MKNENIKLQRGQRKKFTLKSNIQYLKNNIFLNTYF